ncbi:MAG: BspA family leucine-rich repeat surface protein [archaeon]|nr:BspA family leucine-rich repeat surface protein [archaeon]
MGNTSSEGNNDQSKDQSKDNSGTQIKNEENFTYTNTFYICPICFKIPQIQMRNNTLIDIHCTCSDVNKHFIETDGHSDIKELAKGNFYTLTLDTYLNSLKENQSIPKIQCNICSNNNQSLFYCLSCDKYLCSQCKIIHTKKHRIVDFSKDSFSEENLQKIKTEEEKILSKIEEENKKFSEECLLKIPKNKQQEALKILQKKEKEEEKIKNFYLSLLNPYFNKTVNEGTNICIDYNIKNNILLNNHLLDLIEFRKEYYKHELSILSPISKSNSFKAHYNIENTEENPFRRKLFGDEFNLLNDDNCIMFIDGVESKFVKELDESEYDIEIKLKEGKFLTSMAFMFSNCGSLVSLDLSNLDTSQVEDMQSAFYNCENLTELNLKGIDTYKVKNFESTFEGTGLREIDLSSFKFDNATTMFNMFANNMNITEIDLNPLNFKTSNLTNISALFKCCRNLRKINNLQKMDTSRLILMDYFCYGCSNLKEIDVSGFKTSKVINMCNSFAECSVLENLDVKGFDTILVQDMFMLFSACHKLKKLELKNWDTFKVKNTKRMFWCCGDLEEVDISGFDLSNSNTEIMITKCPKLEREYGEDSEGLKRLKE